MKYLFTLAVTILFVTSLSAQSNYKPGYFINTKGDTTRGFIDYREWSDNPDIIDFKNNLNDNQRQHLTPNDVKMVGITGLDFYHGYMGKISADTYSYNGRDTSFEQKSTFLKLLNRGNKIALYDYRDRVKTRYFFTEDGQPPVELIFHSYRQNDQNIDERTYRKQLSVIASKIGKLNDHVNNLIQRTDYNEDDLAKVLNAINDTNEGTSMDALAKGGKTIRFFVGVAANLTSYKTDAGVKFAGAPDATSVLPRINAGFNVYLNPTVQQLVLRVEAGAALGSYSTAYTSPISPYNDAIFKFKQLNVFVSPQVLFNIYNAPGFKFFVGAGLQASLISYSGKEFHNADGTPSTLAKQPFEYFIKSANSIVLKTGFVINKKIEVNAGYQTVTDVSQDSYYRITNTGIHLGVNYLLK